MASAGKASSSGGSAGSGGNPVMSHGGSPSGGSANGGTSTFVVGGTNPGGTTGGSTFVGDGGKATGTSGSTSTGTAGTGVSSNPNLYAAGNVSDVPLGSLVIAAGLFLVGHDAQGIYAMSMQCPHKGCAVVFEGERLDCPCHHSKFDRNGNVLVGPATSPLPHLAVTIDGAGNIFVDKYATVGLSVRTPI
jgi:Rieske Fe-S protein